MAFLLWLLTAWSVAAQPANDECVDAIVTTGSSQLDNTGATDSTNFCPTCTGSDASDVWFKYTANCTGSLILVASGDNNDVSLCVFTGSCANLEEVQCRDNAYSGFQEVIYLFNVTNQTNYYINVAHSDLSTGTVYLDVFCAENVPNRNCAAALPLQTGLNLLEPNWGATTNSTPADCEYYSADTWYSYQAPCTGLVSGTAEAAGGGFDISIGVWHGTCMATQSSGCYDTEQYLPEEFSFVAVQGQTYWLTVAKASVCIPIYGPDTCSFPDPNFIDCFLPGVNLTLSCGSTSPTVSPTTNTPTPPTTLVPTLTPTPPTLVPTKTPTKSPTSPFPTIQPTNLPTKQPSLAPTAKPTPPTLAPSSAPSSAPSATPTNTPTGTKVTSAARGVCASVFSFGFVLAGVFGI